ncbi:MAG TPA: hypothetical protein VFB63_21755 [Bryobacteraceae bacterium]|nr:hypothetical protein [Bryobacteraceae bacterium]
MAALETPPSHGEGEFVSDQPFFDIDEISQKAEFYPPGQPLMDKNVGGNPASRQRVGDMPGGNFWRRRLLVEHLDEGGDAMSVRQRPHSQEVGFINSLGLSGSSRGPFGLFGPNEIGQAPLSHEAGDPVGRLHPRSYAQADVASQSDPMRSLGSEPPQSSVMQSIKPVDIPSKTNGRVIGRRYELETESEKGGVIIQEVHGLSGSAYFRGRGLRNVEGPAPYS